MILRVYVNLPEGNYPLATMLTSQVLEVHVALPAGRRDWPQGGVELWYAHHPGHGGGESGTGGSGDPKDSANVFFSPSHHGF